MNYAAKAIQTINKIDQKAAQAARLLSKNPLAAISILGELRGMIEGLKTDVKVVASERDAMERLARAEMDLPPHPADSEPLIPATNLELSVEAAIAADYAEAEYHMRRDEELTIEEDAMLMWE